jgi:hypothetical protein
MLVEVDRRIQVGDEVGLRFDLPTNGAEIVGTARVVRRAGPSRVGLEFLELEGDSNHSLGKFLDAEGGL